MKVTKSLLAVLLLLGALVLNAGYVQADQNVTDNGKPVGMNPADDL